MRIYSLLIATALWAAPLFAQAQAPAPAAPAPAEAVAAPATGAPGGTLSICNGAFQIGPPATLPPAGSGPVVYNVVLCFPKQGNVSLVEPQTYLYYMQSPDLVSLPSRNEWKPYNDQAEQTIVADHKRLWATNFLDDLSI